jgi:hypothetical protein
VKTLAELRDEIEAGAVAYCRTNPEIDVHVDGGFGPEKDKVLYLISLPGRLPSGIGEGMGYPTLDALIADAIVPEVTAPVWSTAKTPEERDAFNNLLGDIKIDL